MNEPRFHCASKEEDHQKIQHGELTGLAASEYTDGYDEEDVEKGGRSHRDGDGQPDDCEHEGGGKHDKSQGYRVIGL